MARVNTGGEMNAKLSVEVIKNRLMMKDYCDNKIESSLLRGTCSSLVL